MKQRLTERQNQAYEFIRAFIRKQHKPPTLQEMGQALGLRSTNAVHKLVTALEQKGYLRREQHAARGLTLLEADPDGLGGLDAGGALFPLVSRAASDQPHLLRHRPRKYFTVDPFFTHNLTDDDALIVRAGDDGMNGEGIRKGDFLVVQELPLEALRNGEVVAALVQERVLVRRYQMANGRLHLRPADRTYTEETFAPGSPACYVVGAVVALLRRFER